MALANKLLEIQVALQDKIHFDATNPHFKNDYITLGAVLKAVRPECQARGVLLTQALDHVPGGGPSVRTSFVDIETQEEWTTNAPIVLEKATPQGQGSAYTYLKRYSVLSALGLVADADDDAEEASWERSQSTRKPQASRSTTARF